MRLLVLFRHAKAVKADPAGDHARALNGAGRAAAALAGERIAGLLPADALVVASDARRTRETAQLAFPSRTGPDLRLEPKLYLASCDTILKLLRSLPPTLPAAVLVGHNPGLSEIAQLLAGHGAAEDLAAVADGLSTADAVAYDIETSWAEVAPHCGRIKAVLSRRDADG